MRLAGLRSTGLLLIPAVILFFSFHPYDDGFIQRLLEQFRVYNGQHPIEKVYIHCDRDAYLIGETIWLKGYIFDGKTHEADTLSRVLYVELVDLKARRVRLRTQLRATSSYAPGQLLLPDSLPSGSYQLRGYTNFMRNYPDDFFFTKTVTILRADEPSSTPPTPNAIPKPDAQFLPEGGHLVAGLTSRVAFKVVNPAGEGLAVKGFVLDTKKDTVIGFSTTHLGMGFFDVQAGTRPVVYGFCAPW